MHAKFFVFEGGEGSGKSDKSKFAVEHLKSEGRDVVWTFEPGGSEYGKKIRELIFHELGGQADAETLFGLFWAARRDHMKKLVIPALERGAIVICDRFDASTFAYQICGQEQRQLENLFWQMRDHYVGSWEPAMYIYCDVEIPTGLARAKSRVGKTTHFDDREVTFHERVKNGYSEFFGSLPSHRSVVIDANGSMEDARRETLQILNKAIA
jgi:dTMP kinase